MALVEVHGYRSAASRYIPFHPTTRVREEYIVNNIRFEFPEPAGTSGTVEISGHYTAKD